MGQSESTQTRAAKALAKTETPPLPVPYVPTFVATALKDDWFGGITIEPLLTLIAEYSCYRGTCMESCWC